MTKATELPESAIVQILTDRTSSHEALAKRYGCAMEIIRDTRYGKRFVGIRPDLPRWTGKAMRARPTEEQIIGVLTARRLNLSEAGRMFDMNYATVRKIRFGQIYKDVRPDVPRWDKEERPERRDFTHCVHYEQPRELPWPFCEDLAPRNCCALEIPDACPAGCAAFLERTP